MTLRYWLCNKFILQFCFRLVEEEEISGEVKAEFKEKTKVRQLQLKLSCVSKQPFDSNLSNLVFSAGKQQTSKDNKRA